MPMYRRRRRAAATRLLPELASEDDIAGLRESLEDRLERIDGFLGLDGCGCRYSAMARQSVGLQAADRRESSTLPRGEK
jgi:hypothetical protein